MKVSKFSVMASVQTLWTQIILINRLFAARITSLEEVSQGFSWILFSLAEISNCLGNCMTMQLSNLKKC